MEVIIVTQEEVAQLLPMSECIDIMEDTLKALSNGKTILPLRTAIPLPRGDIFGLMPSYIENIQSVGAKVITVFPKNHGTEFDAHQGVVLIFDTKHGSLKGIVDATAITGIRTAAVSAVATKVLAKPDASDLAILGTGTQGRGHLEAMSLVKNIKRIRVWSIYPDEAKQFAVHESNRLGITVEAMNTVKETVEGADLICTTTPAKEPILMGEWIAPGAHINAIGACTPFSRELSSSAVQKAKLFSDKNESVLKEAGEFIIPKQEGVITNDHLVGEIGDVLLNKIEGRNSEQEVTLFKALGLAIEDLAAAHYIREKALAKGMGQKIKIGGRHFGNRTIPGQNSLNRI